jgi:hypothetical protein
MAVVGEGLKKFSHSPLLVANSECPEKVEVIRAAPMEAQSTLSGNQVAKSPAEILLTPLGK